MKKLAILFALLVVVPAAAAAEDAAIDRKSVERPVTLDILVTPAKISTVLPQVPRLSVVSASVGDQADCVVGCSVEVDRCAANCAADDDDCRRDCQAGFSACRRGCANIAPDAGPWGLRSCLRIKRQDLYYYICP